MHTAMEILQEKGGGIYSVSADTKVIDAIHEMNRHKIGALVVMDEERLAGIFTERDVLRRVIGDGRDATQTRVADVMTRDVVCCRPDHTLSEISTLLQQQRVRHLPVCDASGHLHGLISIGDVNACHAGEQEQQILFLNDYIYGRA